MQEALSDSEEETQEAPSDPEETWEALSEHKGETEGVAALAELEGPIVLVLRKLTISENLPPIMSSRTRSRRVRIDVEGAALQSLLPITKKSVEEGAEESMSVSNDGGPMALQVKADVQQ